MLAEKIVQIVEIDMDYCAQTWAIAPCLAGFGANVTRKCFNTFPTCTYKPGYTKTVNTLRFIESSYSVKDGNYIPALRSVSGREQTVNIAGFTETASGMGVRASVKVTIQDFTDRDVLTDKYWAGRMDGSAQSNGVGYDPMTRGTFWSKFKARNPNYSGRPLRTIQARYDASGMLVFDKIRHYVIEDITGPSNDGIVEITAKDVLALAEDKKAIAPVTSRGTLTADMTIDTLSLTLNPAGIGAEYPIAGYVTIGSEIMRYERSGDVLSVERGRLGTPASTHNINDTVQVAYNVSRVRADTVIRDLLVNYARIPASYINFAEWQAEFDTWGSTLMLSATICKPTGVASLISEINNLGVTIWWDEVSQLIRIKLNHPPEQTPVNINDRDNIISIKQEDNDDVRVTRVSLWTMQIDPTKDLTKSNFLRNYITVFVDGESVNFYNEETTKTFYTRWLNHGDDAAAKIITGRLLVRYRNAPVTYTVELDYKDDLQLTDVVNLESYVTTDVTGTINPTLAQVFYRSDTRYGHRITAKLQRFLFDGRYGKITENTRPTYNASTPAQRLAGTYLVGPTLLFADGSGPYRFI